MRAHDFKIPEPGKNPALRSRGGAPPPRLRGGSGMGPDGMAIDADLAVCHVGRGSIWLFSRLGRPLAEIQSCAGIGTTNAA